MLTREQLQANIDSLEKQGAKPDEIQGWLNSLSTQKPTVTPAKENVFDKVGNTLGKIVGGVKEFITPKTFIKTAGTTIAAPILELQGKHEQAQKLVNENINSANIIFSVLETYPGGKTLSPYLKKIPGGEMIAAWIKELPADLKNSAVENYLKILKPTTKEMKVAASKVAPELAERKVIALSKNSLLNKSEAGMSVAGDEMNKIVDALPDELKTKISPLVSELEKSKSRYMVNGVVVNKEAVAPIENMQRLLIDQMKATNGQVSMKSIREVRQILDGMAAEGGAFADRTMTYNTRAEKALAGIIREELAKQSPDLAKINAEYSFWKNVNKVLDAGVKRDMGKGATVTEKAATIGGAMAGIAKSTTTAAKYAIFGRALASLVKSTAWNTVSAANKMRLADLISSGKMSDAEFIASKLLAGLHNQIK